MTTRYGLLPVPDLPGRWGHRVVSSGEGWIRTQVTATSSAEAEIRSLAVLDYDFEDDLRGATATATHVGGALWEVEVRLAP